MSDLTACTKADHPAEPHYHYGYGGRWARQFPQWDPNASRTRYTKEPPAPVSVTITAAQWESEIRHAKASALRDAAATLPGFNDTARWLRDLADEIEAGR